MSLRGKRIAIVATRRAEELMDKISAMGGKPTVEDFVFMRSVQEEKTIESLKECLSTNPEIFIFTTGEGAKLLFHRAKVGGLYQTLVEGMKGGLVIARGYKARVELIRQGLSGFLIVEGTEDVKGILKDKELKGKSVLLQTYGEDVPLLIGWLEEMGAKVFRIWTYRYLEDEEKTDKFINRLISGFYHAVLFTSAYQVSYLFRRAKKRSLHNELSVSFNKKIFVFAVGRTTARKLFENGVLRIYYPEKERLSGAIEELKKVFENA
ncbi:MAG: uroporphyrinogen-III synthase [Aquificaceae bacterium]|nr:uroporphyrinogen-III synthase [Aquificaceae bacterium]